MNNCDGTCKRYKAKRGTANKGWYTQGFKRCMSCDLFVDVGMGVVYCPCCGRRLRISSRNKKAKERMRNAQNNG